jgi:hypothetical protein
MELTGSSWYLSLYRNVMYTESSPESHRYDAWIDLDELS